MSFEPGLRRSSPDERPLPPSDPVLVERLLARIEADGPITFAEFMAAALTDPEHGYYTTSDDRPSRTGDFLTAPELHPIFGAVLARTLVEQWQVLGRPDPFVLREDGAGSGALAQSLLDALATDGSDLLAALVYAPVELSPGRVERIRERLSDAGHQRVVERTTKLPGAGTVIANEYLDALPVNRVEWRDGRLVELFVGWSGGESPHGEGRFVEVPDAPSTTALAERLASEGIVLGEGQRAEVCLGIEPWVAGLAATIERGFVVVIDYGRPGPELYGPSRAGGTLRAYTRHRAHADPFVAVGRQDLTTHVDFSAVERALETNGWRAIGLTTQAEFLTGAGLGELLRARQADPALTAPDYLALRSSVMRLLDPAALGAFRVLVGGRGVPEDVELAGLGYRLRR